MENDSEVEGVNVGICFGFACFYQYLLTCLLKRLNFMRPSLIPDERNLTFHVPLSCIFRNFWGFFSV